MREIDWHPQDTGAVATKPERIKLLFLRVYHIMGPAVLMGSYRHVFDLLRNQRIDLLAKFGGHSKHGIAFE